MTFLKNTKMHLHNFFLASLFFFATTLLGCGGTDFKEGNINDLLSNQDNSSILSKQAMMVETISTTLEPQVDEYIIGPNDILNITVLGHEEVSSQRDFNRGIVGTVVKKDGNIYLPIVGTVKVSGFTVESLHKHLSLKLKTYIKEPHITVDVLKYASQKFFMLGEFNTPGTFPVDGDTTLLEAIGMAGGIKETGSLEGAYVVRGKTLLPVNIANLLLRGDTSRNIYMKDQDLVYIPSVEDKMVYVLGEVKNPGSVPYPRGRLSLSRAIAHVGGLNPETADESSIKVIRGNWQEPVVYTLEYEKAIMYGDSIILSPGDRIIVQPTALTTASRYMQKILPFLAGADHATQIIYRIKNQ